ncbi:MAG: hypothetical protein CL678_07230 [Bdellovibrionaceae bacterium]|nr:hypothetical protein [Pseudobdellovibrionaceae bacterium]
MKTVTSILCLLILSSCATSPNKSQSTSPSQSGPIRLYQGPPLSKEKRVLLIAEKNDSNFTYFISVNKEKIKNRSLMSGPTEIELTPGDHSVQMRFIAKGKLAIPLQAFEKINFKAGKTYLIKSKFIFGEGSYITSAQNTRITVWIEETSSPKKLSLMTLNGFGRKVK